MAPLIYVQVVTLVTYFLFMVSLVSGQNLIARNEGDIDTVFAIFTIIRLMFAVGGLRVGEEFLSANPILLLFRWKGGLWKSLWKSLLLFLTAYFVINLSYRFALNDDQQNSFEKAVRDCRQWEALIPYEYVLIMFFRRPSDRFLLCLFIVFVLGRFMMQYFYLLYIDETVNLITVAFPGTTEESLLVRRQLVRYIILLNMYFARSYSAKVMLRAPFPGDTMGGYSGLKEIQMYTDAEAQVNAEGTGKILQGWIADMVMYQCWKKKCSEQIAMDLLRSINRFMDYFSQNLFVIDTAMAPLIYVQVVTLVTYFLFMVSLISGQKLIARNEGDIDTVFAIFTIIRLMFTVGGLRVGEEFLCGYGDKEESFEISSFFDRMLAVGFQTVDKLADEHPPLRKDAHFDDKYFISYHTYSSLKSLLNHDYYCPQSRLGNRKPGPNQTKIVKQTYDVNVKQSDKDLAELAEGVMCHGGRRNSGCTEQLIPVNMELTRES